MVATATGLCAAIVVIAIAILPFLTPAWFSFEQGRAQSAAWTGYDQTQLRTATEAILHDLVLGPPDFAVQVDGKPVLNERERSHMRNVRAAFAGFFALAGLAALTLGVLAARARRLGRPGRAWRAIATGMRSLIVAIGVAGVIATFFFDPAFELFHRLLFPGGSYTFDPRTDRLVQLFPDVFWSETTIVVGVAIVLLGCGVWFIARGRAGHTSPLTTTSQPAGLPVATRSER